MGTLKIIAHCGETLCNCYLYSAVKKEAPGHSETTRRHSDSSENPYSCHHCFGCVRICHLLSLFARATDDWFTPTITITGESKTSRHRPLKFDWSLPQVTPQVRHPTQCSECLSWWKTNHQNSRTHFPTRCKN
jgi:ferredoxin